MLLKPPKQHDFLIGLFHGMFYIKGPVPDEVLRQLCFTRRLSQQEIAEKEEQLRKSSSCKEMARVPFEERLPLYAIQFDVQVKDKVAGVWVHSGILKSSFMRVCDSMGYAVEIIDKRTPLPEITLDPSAISWRLGQREAVYAIIRSGGMGIVDAPTAFGKSFVIRQLCRIWGNSRIAVVAASSDVMKNLYKELVKEFTVANVSRLGDGHKDHDPTKRIVVAMVHSIHKMDSSWPAVLLCDECHNHGATSLAENIGRFPKTPRFGFSASAEKRSDGATKLIKALFGDFLFRQTYQVAQAAGLLPPVHVWMYKIMSCSEITTGCYSPAQYERANVWNNSYRNQYMVNVAKFILSEYGDSAVLMICKTTEHVLRLHKLLPDSVVVYGKVFPEDIAEYKELGLWSDSCAAVIDTDAVRDKVNSGWKGIVIATLKWSEGVDMPSLKYVIRLDAMASRIKSDQIPGRAVRPKQLAILVDCLDVFSVQLHGKSRARIREYKSHGWIITDPAEKELKYE